MNKGYNNERNMERVRQKCSFNCMAVLLRERQGLSGRASSTASLQLIATYDRF